MASRPSGAVASMLEKDGIKNTILFEVLTAQNLLGSPLGTAVPSGFNRSGALSEDLRELGTPTLRRLTTY
jgi:hypothetical protein